ncbi:MAG: tetratricopeptide repeat protein [Candidatus Tantalella remota]|nr:tetratricopeptide repeat protein [Candidatus Tantalella remota]
MWNSKTTKIIIIVILCGVIYGPSLQNGFIWDDDDYVYENELVQDSGGLKDIWFARKTVQYYPVVFTSFWIEHKVWGLNPFGYHLVNLLLHIANALLLFALVGKLYPRAAFVVALIFAVHPIQVETVAWITERKNLLSLFFFLMTLLSYFKYLGRRKAGQYCLTLALFVCALLSKSVSVCFVAVPILYQWWKEGKVTLREVKISVPFLAAGALSAWNTAYIEYHGVGARGAEWSFSLLEKAVLAGRTMCFYIYKLCVPGDFLFFYPRWEINATQWWQWIPLLTLLAAAVILYGARKRIGRGAIALFVFYGISIFPAAGIINVFPMKYSFVADHFSYISVPTLLLLIAGAAMYGFDNILSRTSVVLRKPVIRKTAYVAILTVITGSLALKSFGVTGNYRDQFTLWTDLIERNPSSQAAHVNLGRIYEQKNEYEKAAQLYRRAVQLLPDDFVAYYNLGNAYRGLGEDRKAILAYTKAIEIYPNKADMYNNLGNAYKEVGDIKMAIAQFEKAISVDPGHPWAYNNLGVLYGQLGDTEKARAYYGKAVSVDPGYADAYFNLSVQSYRAGQYGVAVGYCDKAIKTGYVVPPAFLQMLESYRGLAAGTGGGEDKSAVNTVEMLNWEGEELGRAGRVDEAIETFSQALEIDPDNAETLNNLGYAYYVKGDREKGKAHFEKAIEVDPLNEKARQNLEFIAKQAKPQDSKP